ncbi:MAG TPA: Mth938-like domain-containing protein [Nitrospirota bacterium]|nr:Mth938-like domain-containing protein [Nitrospirota bacterium]
MKIDSYSFGSLVVDGKKYTSDVIIYPGRVDPSWWRKEGHRLQISDLAEVLNAKPQILIVGTGYSGMMGVPKETENYIRSQGIDIHVATTGRAVELFNTCKGKKTVIAALHLTC